MFTIQWTPNCVTMSVKIVVSVTEIADMSSKDRYVIEGIGKSISKTKIIILDIFLIILTLNIRHSLIFEIKSLSIIIYY